MKTVEVVDSADVRQRLLLLAIYEFLSETAPKPASARPSEAVRAPEMRRIQVIGLPVLARNYEAELVQTRRIRRPPRGENGRLNILAGLRTAATRPSSQGN